MHWEAETSSKSVPDTSCAWILDGNELLRSNERLWVWTPGYRPDHIYCASHLCAASCPWDMPSSEACWHGLLLSFSTLIYELMSNHETFPLNHSQAAQHNSDHLLLSSLPLWGISRHLNPILWPMGVAAGVRNSWFTSTLWPLPIPMTSLNWVLLLSRL